MRAKRLVLILFALLVTGAVGANLGLSLDPLTALLLIVSLGGGFVVKAALD